MIDVTLNKVTDYDCSQKRGQPVINKFSENPYGEFYLQFDCEQFYFCFRTIFKLRKFLFLLEMRLGKSSSITTRLQDRASIRFIHLES
jgi:hypothetical protein